MFRSLTNFIRNIKKINSDNLLKNYAIQLRNNTPNRDFVNDYLSEFNQGIVEKNTSKESFTLAVITDTHTKDSYSPSFYGINGLIHTQELGFFDRNEKINLKVHLGDAIDGSDNPENSKTILRLTVKTLNNSKIPFAIVKGNHDENDKYDEHTFSKKASFNDDSFAKIVNPILYDQPQIKYISEDTGLYYFDKGSVRTIFINTSDVPYQLNVKGIKKYDFKKVRAVREKQIKQMVKILENSSGKKIVVLGHAPLVNSKGEGVLTYNGLALQELFVAFNNRIKGKVFTDENSDFSLNIDFDFSKIKNARIAAYICGHKHYENDFIIEGITHVLLNCSALMGKNHGLTNGYNKKWDRKINESSEFAGYVIDINPLSNIINVLGYGSASKIRRFKL